MSGDVIWWATNYWVNRYAQGSITKMNGDEYYSFYKTNWRRRYWIVWVYDFASKIGPDDLSSSFFFNFPNFGSGNSQLRFWILSLCWILPSSVWLPSKPTKSPTIWIMLIMLYGKLWPPNEILKKWLLFSFLSKWNT